MHHSSADTQYTLPAADIPPDHHFALIESDEDSNSESGSDASQSGTDTDSEESEDDSSSDSDKSNLDNGPAMHKFWPLQKTLFLVMNCTMKQIWSNQRKWIYRNRSMVWV